MKFVGLDFGWMRGESGVALLETDDAGTTLALIEVRALPSTEAVLAWLDARVSADEPALVAVDAPTIIPEGVSMRVADKLTHARFGRQHAGAYPANRGLPFAASTLALGAALEARGFAHAPTIEARAAGRYQIECFPHPAMLRLFGLPTILRYKKGPVAERRAGLERLGVSRVMVYMYLIPVAGVGLSAAFFGDPLTTARVLGGLIVLAGVILTRVALDRAARLPV